MRTRESVGRSGRSSLPLPRPCLEGFHFFGSFSVLANEFIMITEAPNHKSFEQESEPVRIRRRLAVVAPELFLIDLTKQVEFRSRRTFRRWSASEGSRSSQGRSCAHSHGHTPLVDDLVIVLFSQPCVCQKCVWHPCTRFREACLLCSYKNLTEEGLSVNDILAGRLVDFEDLATGGHRLSLIAANYQAH